MGHARVMLEAHGKTAKVSNRIMGYQQLATVTTIQLHGFA